MTTGSLTSSPWLFKKYRADGALRLPRHGAAFSWPAVQPAGCLKAARLYDPSRRGPTPSSRPPEGRLLAGGLAHTLKVRTHIMAIRRGVATVKPATPKSRSKRGHSAPYGEATPRLVRNCCHVDHDITHDRLSVRPTGGGPLLPERYQKAAELDQSA